MKILIVSWFFPPTNTMGALRVGKLADFLLFRGHDVRVLSAADVPRPQDLPTDFPSERVERTDWYDVNRIPRFVSSTVRRGVQALRTGHMRPGATSRDTADGASVSPDRLDRNTIRAKLGEFVEHVIYFPDRYVGWLPYAVRGGRKLCDTWRPDLVFASSPPVTGLLAGRALADYIGCKWVAEFRDRWVEDPYSPPPHWRNAIERVTQRRLIRSAAGLVTVSEPWAEEYRHRYGKPTIAVYNGYDPADYNEEGLGSPESNDLVVVYTGRIYPGRRDPSPLFEAMRLLGDRHGVRAVFYGAEQSQIVPAAAAFGVNHRVSVHPHVPYEQSLRAQMQADVLLFMQWNDPREEGNVPGKLFEYLAARRPILALGYENTVPANIVRERAAGFFINDPAKIATQLEAWIKEKRTTGCVARLPRSVPQGFSREEQFATLLGFLERMAGPVNSLGDYPTGAPR